MLITQRLSLHVVSCIWRPFWSIMAWTAKHTFTSVLTRLQNEGVLRMVEDKWFSVFMMCPSRTWPMAFCYSVSFFPVLSLLFADPTIILEGIEKTRGVFCSFLVFLFHKHTLFGILLWWGAVSAHCLGGQGTRTISLAFKLLQQRQQTRLKQIVLFILVVIGTEVLKQETELVPTTSKKLMQPSRLAYQASHKFWRFYNLAAYIPCRTNLWNHMK